MARRLVKFIRYEINLRLGVRLQRKIKIFFVVGVNSMERQINKHSNIENKNLIVRASIEFVRALIQSVCALIILKSAIIE